MLKFGFVTLVLAVGSFPSLINAACDMLKCPTPRVSISRKEAFCSALEKHITCLKTFEDNRQCAMNQRMDKAREEMLSSSQYSMQCQESSAPKDGSGPKDDSNGKYNPLASIFGNQNSGGGNRINMGRGNDPECDLFKKCPHVTKAKGKTSAYCSALNSQVECVKGILVKCPGQIANKGLGQIQQNYKDYDCGVAGLAASTLLCLVVCLMSMLFKG